MHPVAGALLFLAVWYLVRPLLRWKWRHIPGPIGLPLIGNLTSIVTLGMPAFVQQLEKKHGRIFKFWFGSNPWIVVADVDMARQLNYRFNARATFEHTNVMSGEVLEQDRMGVVALNGPRWRAARRAFDAALLYPNSLSSYAPVMDGCASRLVGRLARFADSGEVIDMWRELGNMTLTVVGECAYGVDFHSMDDGKTADAEQLSLGARLVDACRTVFKQGAIDQASIYVPFQLMFPALTNVIRFMADKLPDAKHTTNLHARLLARGLCQELIEEFRKNHPSAAPAAANSAKTTSNAVSKASQKEPDASAGSIAADGEQSRDQEQKQAGSGKAVTHVKETSFLSALLMGKGREGEPRMTDAEVTAQAFTFLLAGYETTANSLAFAVYLLSACPEAQARLLAEVDAFDKTGAKAITAADTAQLPYALAVVREALRMYSPAGGTTRMATEDVEVFGKKVHKGATVFFPTQSFQLDPRYWPRPDEFLPERFLKEEQEKRARGEDSLYTSNDNAYLPFGAGARMCVGYKFAEMEATFALVRLYQRYTFELIPGMGLPIETKTGITTGPAHGVPVTVHRR